MITLNEHEQAQFEANMTNPSRSLGDAWFFAGITTVDDETFATLRGAMDELFNIGTSLIGDGLLNQDEIVKTGLASTEFMEVAKARANEDPRFARIVELTKLRFLVQGPGADAGANMAAAIIAGEPFEVSATTWTQQ